MIREDFLERAVTIRRTYLSLTKNLDSYLNKVEGVSKRLEKTMDSINKLEEDFLKETNQDLKYKNEKSLKELLSIIDSIEDEGKKLESIISPLNKDIEKLSKEEVELYNLIKQTHSNLTENQIVESVKSRLIKEGLI
jgi:predicted  nucleic acid-binding Zn-ribbon protein